jgi:capsular exopolysaccharide synthesis family protein
VNNQQETYQEQTIEFKEVLFKFYKYYYLFIITIIISLFFAFLFNKYSKPIYESNTTVLIQDEKKHSVTNPGDFMEGFGLFAGKKNLENEIGVLQSYTLINEVVTELNLGTSYFIEEHFISNELYKKSPFVVIIDSLHPQSVNLEYNITILNSNEFRIKAESQNIILYNFIKNKTLQTEDNINIDKVFRFGEKIENKNVDFKLFLTDNYTPDKYKNKHLYFTFNNIDALTLQYQNSVNVEPITKDASIVKISLKGNNIQKSVDFLNTLTSVYLKKGLEKKNRIAINTIQFIDNQLLEITDSLHFTESKLQSFRTTNKVMDLSFQAQKAYEKMQNLEEQKAVLFVKSKYYNYLKEYIEKNKNVEDLLVPSTMGIDDLLLNDLVLELTKLSTQKITLLYNSKEKNPYIGGINLKIKNTKKALLENIQNIVNTSDIAIKDINNRMSELTKEISKLPKTERELFGIERKFKLNDAIYTYLLQKRSEAQIAKASNLPNNEIIDSAMMVGQRPVSPKKKINYLIAVLLGIILPATYIFIKDFFNDKIIEKKDIEDLTDIPVLGFVIHSKKNKNGKKVVSDYPKSLISESFRSVRTNLQFFSKGKEKQTILITSSLTNEGKTFFAINLALIFAISGKKTVLLDFDLRKPQIYQDFGLNNEKGISNYLINKCEAKDIVQNSNIENLDVITAGPVPPNPAELIASTKVQKMFIELKKIYDYIIVDTSPIGLVTDAFLLTKYSDINVFVVRQNQTDKKVFIPVINGIEKNKINNLNILINDVKVDKHSGYGGYGYGAKYGYYDDEKTKAKSLFKRIFGKSNIIGII